MPARETDDNRHIEVYPPLFVEEADHLFLKTIIPSRKASRDYLKGGGPRGGA